VAKEAATQTNNIGNGFSRLAGFIKGAIILAAAKQLGEAAIEATKLAGNVEGVQRAFDKAFPNSTQILNNLRTATRGTITDFELMQRTLQATNLGVSVEKLPILFEFAAARAQQTGESVDYLVDSIVRGIGRKSILVLDNLGLSATRLREQFHGASLQAQTVADVTAGVAAIAKVELEKMGGYVETGATKVAQLGTAWENLKIALSKRLDSSNVVSFFATLTNSVRDLIIGEKGLAEQEAKNRAAREVDAIIQSDEYQLSLKNNEDKIHFLSLELVKQVEILTQRKGAIKLLNQEIALQDAGTMSGGAVIEQLNKTKKAQELDSKTREEAIGILRKYIVQLRSTEVADNAQIGIIEKKREEIKALNDQIDHTTNRSDIGANGKLILALKQAEEELSKLLGTFNEVKKKFPEFTAVVDIAFKDPKTGEVKKTQQQNFIQKFMKDLDIDFSNAGKDKVVQVPLQPFIPLDAWDKLEIAIKDNASRIAQAADTIISDQANFTLNKDVVMYDMRIQAAHNFYENQITLAGDNEKAKSALRIKEDREIKQLTIKRAEAEKKAALGGIVVNTALGIIKAIATAVSVYDGLIKSAVVAAEGASQYAIASGARYYAKGEIDIKGGTPGKDSIPAMLMPRESIMTADETVSSGRTLHMIRAKKLNDKILDRIMNQSRTSGQAIGFDDSRLIQETRKVAKAAAGNDIVNKAGIIYEAKNQSKNLKAYIRSKSLN
jgi:hypothetical protein